MTCSVFVHLKEPPTNELMKKIDAAFRRVHDQNFTQTVNITPSNPNGERSKMRHGVNFDLEEDHTTIDIPCHWDYNHGVQTSHDIVAVLKVLEVRFSNARVSY